MKRLTCCLFLSLSLALVACAKSQGFDPPVDNEHVTVEIKVPFRMKAIPVHVMYRSAVCRQPSYDGNGHRTDLEGRYSIQLVPERKENTDLYEVRVARSGGGQCQWQLSNVTFAVIYEDPSSFGKGVSTIGGGGGGVVVIFDENNSPRGGATYFSDGDLSISKGYYPWVREYFLGGHGKSVMLYGGRGLYLMYKSPTAKKFILSPWCIQISSPTPSAQK